MVGLIFFALLVYKKLVGSNILNKKSEYLKIDEALSLSPKKTLYVVNAGGEKFLIASDCNTTNLISKLEDTNSEKPARIDRSLNQTPLPSIVRLNSSEGKKPFMKSIVNKLSV